MTLTVRLDTDLEQALRQRCASVGQSASVLIREALRAYLSQAEPPTPSAFALGADLFGKYAGSANLASERKSELQTLWAEKHPASL